ncbi:hypothetical protein [Tabrizicola sp. BL-A-41-H6]|uniref:hypothetical protein n=1 Tax=Tabrizicola sp. BL-A-41-H6 TaxID=3421107 RepID=UPI003D67C5E9
MTQQRVNELVKECRRQEESCKYTAAGLYNWQKTAQLWKNGFIIAPIVLGGFASSQLINDGANPATWTNYVAAGLALLAGFFPAIFEALGMDMRVREIGTAAGEFTNLRDRFRLLGNVGADMTFEELNPAFEQLMDRMDAARKTSPPLPERYFKEGRSKIEAGDYDFEIDEPKAK